MATEIVMQSGEPQKTKEPVTVDHPGVRTSLILAEAAARRQTFTRPRRITGFH